MNQERLDQFTGRTQNHLTKLNEEYLVHQEVLIAFNSLRQEAHIEGIDLTAISTFRPFEEQLEIWNNKATGKRVLLDDNGQPLDFDKLSKEEIVFRILRWSALPGASRHHFGTDIDVIDKNSLTDPNYRVQLVPSEYAEGGIFGKLSSWLDKRISDREAFGFYRPYDVDRGGVAPEMWHLSFRPIADEYLSEFSFEVFKNFLESDAYKNMELREIVLEHAETIYLRYVVNVNPNY